MALVFLDLETTGLDPKTSRILEVAAAHVDESTFQPVNGISFACAPNPGIVVCPPGTVPYEMHTRNGLLQEIADGKALNPSDAIQAICGWLAGLPRNEDGLHTLAGNSVHFDLAFLKNEWAPAAAMFSHRLLDVTALKLARKYAVLPECPIHAGDKHRAQGDVMASIAQARWLMSRQVP